MSAHRRLPGRRAAVWLALLCCASLAAEGPTIEIIQADCKTCNSGLLPALSAPTVDGPIPLPGDCGCCGNNCVPGRTPCHPCDHHGPAGRFFCALYECVCCPDPCYEPKWTPLADAAFFTEAVRPVTQTRFRYDSGQSIRFPDRAEYYWPRADGNGKGPRPVAPYLGETSLRYNDLVMITEGGNGAISAIVETRYRSQEAEQAGHASGFTDLVIGTKTLLFDCELLQISFMFKTYLPTGNFLKGLGVGHTSLEPSLLVGLKLSPVTYLQTQVSEWIPLGGDQAMAGSILHFHGSVNHELCRIMPDVPLIATMEMNTFSFQDGLYTDPVLGLQKASGETYVTLGGGMRLFVCDRIDMGFAAMFAVTENYLARQQYRAEFRVRF